MANRGSKKEGMDPSKESVLCAISRVHKAHEIADESERKTKRLKKEAVNRDCQLQDLIAARAAASKKRVRERVMKRKHEINTMSPDQLIQQLEMVELRSNNSIRITQLWQWYVDAFAQHDGLGAEEGKDVNADGPQSSTSGDGGGGTEAGGGGELQSLTDLPQSLTDLSCGGTGDGGGGGGGGTGDGGGGTGDGGGGIGAGGGGGWTGAGDTNGSMSSSGSKCATWLTTLEEEKARFGILLADEMHKMLDEEVPGYLLHLADQTADHQGVTSIELCTILLRAILVALSETYYDFGKQLAPKERPLVHALCVHARRNYNTTYMTFVKTLVIAPGPVSNRLNDSFHQFAQNALHLAHEVWDKFLNRRNDLLQQLAEKESGDDKGLDDDDLFPSMPEFTSWEDVHGCEACIAGSLSQYKHTCLLDNPEDEY